MRSLNFQAAGARERGSMPDNGGMREPMEHTHHHAGVGLMQTMMAMQSAITLTVKDGC